MVKRLKHFVKEWLFELCRGLNGMSSFIQRRVLQTTLEQKRSRDNFGLPPDMMDEDLLAMYIRFLGHTVEKTVRYEKSAGRGHGKPVLLRAALDEWYRRRYPIRSFIEWAEENLRDYAKWNETGKPQLHPESELPAFAPTSPVFEVLTNRVSTRFWKPVPVEREVLDKLILAATYAPTSCNRQTWKLYVHQNPKLEETSAIPGVDNRTLLQRAPVVIYISIDERPYPEVWAAAQDAGIIGLQLSLAATALGLGGLMMYGGDNFPQEQWRAQFHVPPYRYMHLSFLCGYPAERTLTKKRAHPDDISIYV